MEQNYQDKSTTFNNAAVNAEAPKQSLLWKSKLHGPSMFAVKAKIIECYIIKRTQSLLMKHLVIDQR